MTEDKKIDNPSEESTEASAEKNIQQGDTQNQGPQTPDANATDKGAADQSAKPEDRRDEEQSDASADDKNAPDQMQTVEDFDLNLLLDIPLEITVELGRSKIQIQELLNISPGSTVTLSKLEGEPVDILANDKLIARGEVVLQNKKYGIRITEITSRMNRIKSLH
ncbi:MAG: flagellar motor switch protein FliN [Desulfobacterales bacterium]|jgi:flagellar motor switch protein FliN/FliY